MKIRLINPVGDRTSGLNGNPRSKHPPLSLVCLAAETPENWEVEIVDENMADHTFKECDLVGLTAFTSNAPRAYQIAAEYRQAGIPVIMGGLHAWAMREEALEHVDSTVIKEAEYVWDSICYDVERGVLAKSYDGGPAAEFAIPRRDLLDPGYHVASVQTSRGCNFCCDFCSTWSYLGTKYRRQRLDFILEDLSKVKETDLFLIDDNFVGPGPKNREDVMAILRCMCGMGKTFICQVTIEVCQDTELLELLQEAGCKLLFIGLETPDSEGLRLVGKRQNLKHGFDFTKVHKARMGVLGSFLVGLDSDTPEKLRAHAKFMTECGCDCFQLTVATPLPGTNFFKRLQSEGRLIYDNFPHDWQYFDLERLTYVPRGFRCVEEFYDVMTPLVREVMYSKESIHTMAQRTIDVTGSQDIMSRAFFCNRSYGDIAIAKTKLWETFKENRRAESCLLT